MEVDIYIWQQNEDHLFPFWKKNSAKTWVCTEKNYNSGRIEPIVLKISIAHECFELSTTSHFGQKI